MKRNILAFGLVAVMLALPGRVDAQAEKSIATIYAEIYPGFPLPALYSDVGLFKQTAGFVEIVAFFAAQDSFALGTYHNSDETTLFTNAQPGDTTRLDETGIFGFWIENFGGVVSGQKHFSDSTRNTPNKDRFHVYPAPYPDEWLFGYEGWTDDDYNDLVWLAKGVTPVGGPRSITFGESGEEDYAEVTLDAHIREISYAQERNYGATDNIRVLGANATVGEWRGLLMFDFRPGLQHEMVTGTDQIVNATISLRLSESEGSGAESLTLYRLRRDWGEGVHNNAAASYGEVTWRHARYAIEGWKVAGASDPSFDYFAEPVVTAPIGNTVGTWYHFDVTSSIRQMFSDGQNAGWLLVLEAGAGMRYFNSKECATPAYRPKLTIQIVPEPVEYTELTFGESGQSDFAGVTRDAHIREILYAQRRNYGATDNIRVKGYTAEAKEWKGLLRFDFIPGLVSRGIASADQIIVAHIRLHLSETEGVKNDNLYFYGLRKDWGEGVHNNQEYAPGEVTWVAPKEGETLWSQFGARGQDTDYAATPLLIQSVGNTVGSWYEFEVTASVQTMFASGENFGWILQLEPGAGMRYFNSKEHTANAYRPQLVIAVNTAMGKRAATMASAGSSALPTKYLLEQNYPNPFNPETEIRFALPEIGQVTLTIFNILGEKVRTLVNDTCPSGYHDTMWDGRDEFGQPVASGVYLYRLQAGRFGQTKKMSLLR